eukprot:TRINITY_DN33755_c0_g1_i1.p1 TRINITY_DN33755_c0_g1~~TRINITY_DN33755_c0_g1_i1.p1  ORF type:complete len:1158 (-),score=210.38 TRINITY_DN33755_c0_g1_i1:56-3121(-)
MDDKSFGYGGTAMKSNSGKYSKFGQTYGQDDIVIALIDLERHGISYIKNGHAIPGDAFSVPRHLWGHPFFPHILTKEATITSYFGEGPCPFPSETVNLPDGFTWLAKLPLAASAKQCDHASVKVEDAGAVVEVDTSKLEQAAHRDQFDDWKVKVNAYASHFQQPLAWEYEAEKQSVMHRVKRSGKQLESTGYACFGLHAEMDEKIRLTRPRGIPRLSEISVGRTVLVTEEDTTPDINDPSVSISGEVDTISETAITISTTYERLPPGQMFRVDLGPNMSTYERIDRVLDLLQRAEKPSKKIKSRMGIVSPCTPLADAIFDAVGETAGAAQRWDPSTRPKPNPNSDISKAARDSNFTLPSRSPEGDVPEAKPLNDSQQGAINMVLTEQRRLTLVQGPPGTGKTTTAIEVMCSWLRKNKGPILATAFSNKGVNNLAEGLFKRGVNVLRVGICDAELPFSMDAHLEYYGHTGRKGGGKGAQNDVIKKADVICATVIGSGMSLLRSFDFPCMVIDEAAQIIEPATLIPLAKGSASVVMVGDQCQLPATVISHQAQQAGLDVSLFDRLISLGMQVHMLSVQYRMHPLIAEFPSWRFYDHKLETGIRPNDRQPILLEGLELGTMAIIHVGAGENSSGMSKSNSAEADCVEHIVRAMQRNCDLADVGVITPYSAQVSCIRQSLRGIGRLADRVQVSSVDAFQGSEKEAIVLSMVRSNLRGDIGFVADWRRLNVAVTRAKRLLVVVGNMVTLSQHALWRDFFGHHPDLKVLEWRGRGLGTLSSEPAQLLRAARDIAKRRGVKPLPLRGDYPADSDFAKVERGKLTWDAAPLVDGAENISWESEAAADGDWGAAPIAEGGGVGWGDAPTASASGWGDASVASQPGNKSCKLAVGEDGALLDLSTTRWGMRVDGVDHASRNKFEVGSTIVVIEGVPLQQSDSSEESLDCVEATFGEHFRDGVDVQVEEQEEILIPWKDISASTEKTIEELDVITEFSSKGLLVYGPSCGLEAVRDAIAGLAVPSSEETKRR